MSSARSERRTGMSFHAYLFFDGTCGPAFTRYQEIFSGELTLMRMGDAPDGGMEGADPDMIIHASLQVGDGMLMASDDPTGDGGPKAGVMVSYTAPSVEEANRVYAALAEGGEQTQPMMETFFSPAWGMCTDRFGTPWMVGAPPADASAG